MLPLSPSLALWISIQRLGSLSRLIQISLKRWIKAGTLGPRPRNLSSTSQWETKSLSRGAGWGKMKKSIPERRQEGIICLGKKGSMGSERGEWERGKGSNQAGRAGRRLTVVGSGPRCLKPSLPYGSVTLAANLAQRNYDERLLVLSGCGCSIGGAACYPRTDYLVGDINKGRHDKILWNNKWSQRRRPEGFYSPYSMARDKRTFNEILIYGKIRADERKSS